MKSILMLILVVVNLVQACMSHHDAEEKDKLINSYYNENKFQVNNTRKQRQTNRERFNNAFIDDDWYVFDVVEEITTEKSLVMSTVNLLSTSRKTTTTSRPQIPNAIARRLPPCEEACNLRTTPQYNPVCGDNGITYFNNARFDCAVFCGQRVQIIHRGRCGPLLPFP